MTTPDEEFDDDVEIVDESTLEPVDDADLPTEDQVDVPAPELPEEPAAIEVQTELRTASEVEGASVDQD